MAPESAALGGRSGDPAFGTTIASPRVGGSSPQRPASEVSASLLARLVDGQLELARCDPDAQRLHGLLARLAAELVDADGAAVEQVHGDEHRRVGTHGLSCEDTGVRSVAELPV